MRRGDQVDQLLITQQVGADLRAPGKLGASGDDVSQQRLCALDVNCKVVVDEENKHLAAILAGVSLEPQEFINDAFVRAKPNRVAEESGDSAELAAVGATAT